MEEAALVLKRVVPRESKNSDLPCSPPTGKVLKDISPPPDILYHFAHILINPRESKLVADVFIDIIISFSTLSFKPLPPHKTLQLPVSNMEMSNRQESRY